MSLLAPVILPCLLAREGEASPEAGRLVATAELNAVGGPREIAISCPSADALAGYALSRYIAGVANNLVMVHGGSHLRVRCYGIDDARSVAAEIRSRYPQVKDLLRPPALVSASCDSLSLRTLHEPPRVSGRAVPFVGRGCAIGINVGQSETKVAVATKAGVLPGGRWTAATWPAPGTATGDLAARVLDAVERATAIAQQPIDGVGLALGGIVRGGVVNRQSGVALRLDDDEYQRLTALPQTIAKRYDADVALVQDVEAKAHFHAISSNARNMLILDIGTSLGGAYIDEQGALPPLLNQVGRLAFDYDDDAVPRADGRGDGLLSQYVSARGFVALGRALGIPMQTARDIEPVLAETSPGSTRFARLLRGRVVHGLTLAFSWYAGESVVLSGGVVSGGLGAAIVRWLGDAGVEHVAISAEPIWDAAIGAAWLALDEGRSALAAAASRLAGAAHAR